MSLTALQVHIRSCASGCLCDTGDWVSWYVSGCQDLGEPRREQRLGRHGVQASFACGALADPCLRIRNKQSCLPNSYQDVVRMPACHGARPDLYSWRIWPLRMEVACLQNSLITTHALDWCLVPTTLHHTAHTNSRATHKHVNHRSEGSLMQAQY